MSYNGIQREPSLMEKLIAAGSYIFPMVGFAIIIITLIMKARMKPFLQYHIFQSIFIAFALTVIVYGLSLAMNFLSLIPIIKNIVSVVAFFFNTKLFMGFSVITFAYFLFVLYLVVGAFRGKDSYVPWVSDIVKSNLKGQL